MRMRRTLTDPAGKVVVVTGAGSGMGRAYASAYASKGAVLALGDIDASALDATVASLPPGTTVVQSVYDVSDRAATRDFAERVASTVGPASVVSVHLVHPGGVATNISRAEKSQQFARKYYATSPDEVAERVIRDVAAGKMRIVTGHRSRSVAFGARFLPFAVMSRLVRRDMSDVLDAADYTD